MDFGLTDAQQAIQNLARRFAREQLLPFYQQREREGRIDRDLIREMGSLGLLAAICRRSLAGWGRTGLPQGW